MSEPELQTQKQTQKIACHGYTFDDFTLDLDRGCLWRARQEVKLRYKSFEALKYLIERRRRLVSKAELMQALWPDTFVTDDSLVQCLIEVRRALGDDAQRYVKTVLRRGYIFDAPVSESGSSTSDAPSLPGLPGPNGAAKVEAASAVIAEQEHDEEDARLNDAERDGAPSAASSLARRRWRSSLAVLPAVLIAGLLLAGLVAALVWRSSRPRPAKTVAEVRSIAVLPDEKFTDILSVQEAVAERVSQALALQLTGDERRLLTKRYTNNSEAYQRYLEGRYFLNKRTEAGYQKCIESFNGAIKLDQSYAPAYAGLADAYNMTGLYVFAFSPPREIYPKAMAAAREALRIDGALGEAHTSLAYAKLNYDWDWPEVEREYKRAIELKPDDANLQHWYSHYWMARGRVEESLAASLRATEIDRLDLTLNSHLGWHYLYARQYDLAAEQLLKTIELDQNYVTAHLYLGFVYERKGMNEAAIAELGKAVELSGAGRRPVMEAALGHTYAVAGRKVEAQRAIDGLKVAAERRYISPYSIAVIYLGLGDKEQAFAWLNRAYDERDNWLIYLKVEPRLDPLRSDARFSDLLRRVGLAP